jgi:hypothetical protein
MAALLAKDPVATAACMRAHFASGLVAASAKGTALQINSNPLKRDSIFITNLLEVTK